MAEKRMFSKAIIDSDLFLEMPISSQNLYFHLCMRADDDGFINNPKRIMKTVAAAEDDLKLLIAKQFIIPFESGVVVIKHWKIHNYIRGDRYHETVNVVEKSMLKEAENKEYYIGMTSGIPNDIPTVDQAKREKNLKAAENQRFLLGMSSDIPVVDPDKNRIDKNRIDKKSIYSQIIQHLNLKAGTNYRENIESTQRLITARINQGFVLDDFYKVIDTKCSQWLNNEMKKYLRPETLFGSKFEGYLNETTTQKPKTALDTFSEEEQQ